MLSACLVTPSYANDLERCGLLCESIDRYVTGYSRHYVIVHDEDIALFAPLASPRRLVLPVSRFLPAWLSFGLKPHRTWWLNKVLRISIEGWHIQQLVKLSAAASVAETVTLLIDSDVVFLHPWRIESWLGERPPLYRALEGITAEKYQHQAWLATTCKVLGLAPLQLPATDYIGPIIAWEQLTVRTLLDRISRKTRKPWAWALCRRQEFSEYLLYGCHVASDPAAASKQRWFEASVCHTYWGTVEMSEAELQGLVAAMAPEQVAICVQSRSGTTVELIRAVTGFSR